MLEILFNDSTKISPEVQGFSRVLLQEVADICIQPLPRDMPSWQKMLWGFVFAVMILIATSSNLIVTWIVLGKKFIASQI